MAKNETPNWKSKIAGEGRDENPRTPNHHRTGLIGDDYPIDPYRADAATTYDPYDRYWRTPNGSAFEDAVEQARANIKELKYAVGGFWRQQNTLPKEKILAAYEIAKEAYKSVLYVRSCFFDDAEAQAKQKLDNAKTKFDLISLANDSLDGDLRYTMSSFEETLGNPKVKVSDARNMINGLVHMPAWLNRVLNFYSEPDDFDSRTENPARQNYAEVMLSSGDVIQVRAGDMVTVDPYMTRDRSLKRSKRKVAKATKTRIHLLDGTSYVVKTLEEYTGGSTYNVPETIIFAVNGKEVSYPDDDLFE